MENTSLQKYHLPRLLIIIFSMAFVFTFYGKMIISPNDYMFSHGGDGMKNYFTYAYHIKHNTSYTNFEGMNYPYGESYLYTDSHPILVITFKKLSSVFPFFQTHSVGLLNLLLLLSIFLTFIIIYSLFVELKLNRWMSLFFSISITLLAPQLFRLDGHLALSYSMAIPLTLLIVLKYLNRPRSIYLVLLFLNNIFWMLIHAYLGIIVLFFILTFLIVKILSDRERRNNTYTYLWLGLVVLSPIVLFYAYTIMIDLHEGRTNNPSGFFLYNAELDDVLLPHSKPFRPILDQLTGGVINLKWEAWGYIGLVNSLLFIALTIIGIIAVFNTKARAVLKSFFSNKTLNISLISAAVVLLFAMAIPFKQFPNLLEIFPVLKQFRATGRFVWPFYFAFTLFAAYCFQIIIMKLFDSNKKYLGVLFLLLLFSISVWEGVYYHQAMSHKIAKENLFNKDLLPKTMTSIIDQINGEDYQAIISIPFYYQGSESYIRPRVDEVVRNSIVIAYHTGLPLVCANLTRTSIEESKRIVQLMTPNYYEKKITEDIKSKRPFLIVKTGDDYTKYEKEILAKAKVIDKAKNIELLLITYEDLFSDDREGKINHFNEIRADLITQDSFLVTDSCSVLFYDGFENDSSGKSFRGDACFGSFKKGKNTFAEFAPNTFIKGKEYDLSLWMNNGEQDALNLWFRLIVEEYDEDNNMWFTTVLFPDQAEVINGNWSLVEGSFKVKNPKNKVFIVSKGNENSKAALYADDLMIKDKDIDVYMVNESVLFYNNHKIKLN